MILRTTGEDIAEQAVTGGYIGKPYSQMDCQGFVEQVLKDLGVRKPDGTVYNWRGSNSMFRNYIKWRGTIEECKKKFGEIPEGAFVFLVKHDGGEKEKGYRDDLGNASHVGIYAGGCFASPPCIDSQPSRGVALCDLKVFTHVGLMDMVDYYTSPEPPYTSPEPAPIPEEAEVLKAIGILRNQKSSDREYLEALKKLTKYMEVI